MAAVPKPEPGDWLKAAADELRLGDRATLKLLQESYRAVNKLLGELPSQPDAAFGNLIYRAQLERVRKAILSEQSTLFDRLGDTVSARRLRSATRAAKLSAASDAALLRLVGEGEEGKRLYEGAAITAQRTVETILTRAKLSAVPLSERIYKTSAWMNKRLDRLIASTMAKGLNAKRFAKVARDWFSPSVPGGTRYAAMRLARTEINNAFHATSIVYAQDKPWVSQMEWHLSKSHPVKDICNKVAAASPYDVHLVPPKPHPQCMCYVTEITPGEDDWIDRFVDGEFDGYLDQELRKADEALGVKPKSVDAAPKKQKKVTPSTKAVDVPVAPKPLDTQIGEAYLKLSPDSSKDVPLADLRDELSSVPWEQIVAMLLKLDRERKIQLEPNPNRITLTQRDRDAAIRLGGEDMHLIYIAKEHLDVLVGRDTTKSTNVPDVIPPVVKKAPSDGYVPGNWVRQFDNEGKIAEIQVKLAKIAPKDIGPAELRKMAEEFIADTTDDDDIELVNGPHTIRFPAGSTLNEQQRQTFISYVDRLQQAAPTGRKMFISVDPSGRFGAGVGGETTLATGYMRINEQTLKQENWPGMPISSEVDSALYVLAHEWGHSFPTKEDARDTHAHNESIRAGDMSRYGRTAPEESYAEAFAEWLLSGGKTANRAAQTYAREFGWGERFGIH